MDDSALCPPNSQWLGDSVIGDVVQHSSRSLYVCSAEGVPRNLLHSKSRVSLPKRKRSPASQSKALQATTTENQDNSRGNELERRRERNRLHQARYKMRQNKLAMDLEETIRHLKDEIQELKLQRQLIVYGALTSTNMWSVAAEFFRLFRRKVQAPTALGSEYHVQRNFLRATMAPDVTDGAVWGVEALLQTWASQSLCYEEIDLQPVRMEKGPDNVLFATTKGTLTVNENTLRFAFPHLVRDGRWSALATEMLGQRLTLRGLVQFEWDSTSGRITRVECKADILTPLLHLLGSVDAVSCVFDQARLTPEGRLVVSREAVEVSYVDTALPDAL